MDFDEFPDFPASVEKHLTGTPRPPQLCASLLWTHGCWTTTADHTTPMPVRTGPKQLRVLNRREDYHAAKKDLEHYRNTFTLE